MPLTDNVLVEDTFGNPAHQGPTGVPFTYDFSPRLARIFDPETKRFTTEVLLSSVTIDLPPPYPRVTVDTSLKQ